MHLVRELHSPPIILNRGHLKVVPRCTLIAPLRVQDAAQREQRNEHPGCGEFPAIAIEVTARPAAAPDFLVGQAGRNERGSQRRETKVAR